MARILPRRWDAPARGGDDVCQSGNDRDGTDACIPSSRSRKIPIPHDPAVYRRRHRIENLFARLKDWRRIATRYDRCAHTFMAAITIAAIMIFWINES